MSYDSEAKTQVTFNKDGAAVKLTNVAPGAVSGSSKDAINGAQLFTMADSVKTALGGNSTVDPVTGAISKPEYKVANVADGTVAAGSKEAVNGGQLHATNQVVAQNASDIAALDGRVTTNEGDISTLNTNVSKIDNRVAESQMASGAAAAAVGNPNGAWSVGMGSEQGHGAIAAGYAKPIGKKSQISFGAAFGGSDHSIGVGFAHKL